MRTALTTAIYFIFSCASLPLGAAEVNLALSKALDTIRLEDIRYHTETLASDFFEGREAGRAGGRAAAIYIMKALKKSGLRPAGLNGTYFQPFGTGFRNVLAVLPGADPKLQGENILVSAHYDHVGYGTRNSSKGAVGFIHNGADDNASGVAALLEMADALQNYSPGVSRSVVFVWFDAEEKGLWGSKHWLDQPTVDLANTKMMINVDMVGRLREGIELFGTRSMPGLRAAWSRANLDSELKLSFPWKVFANSDHFPFFQRGIPISMVHTGLHGDYHRPSDDVYRLNLEGIRATTQLLLRFTTSIANAPRIGGYRVASRTEALAEQRNYERLHVDGKPRLGISWRRRVDGLFISSVRTASAADRAGLQPGDLITHIDDTAISNDDQLRRAVGSTFGNLRLRLRRDNISQSIEIPLGGKRPRVGVAWRRNSAEPNVVMISRITPGLPAERAALRRLDRIHSIDGTPIGSDNEFHDRLSKAEGNVELLIERRGQMKQVLLALPPVGEPKQVHHVR